MNRNGPPQNEIADAIGKHPSTVSHELRRLGVCRDYCSVEAQRDAESTTNGKEFGLHKLMAEIIEADAYFAHPCHSWERGLNENTNGLIRQYSPKGTDCAKVTPAQVKKVEGKLNRRPRKCLDYRTQHDIFNSPPLIALAA